MPEQPEHKVNIKLACTPPVVGHGIHWQGRVYSAAQASKSSPGKPQTFPEHCASVDDNLSGQ